jgi:hypothetical protein
MRNFFFVPGKEDVSTAWHMAHFFCAERLTRSRVNLIQMKFLIRSKKGKIADGSNKWEKLQENSLKSFLEIFSSSASKVELFLARNLELQL